MAIALSDEISEQVNDATVGGNPMLLAAVDEAGRPRLSFRGSTQVFSPDQLGLWVRNAEGSTLTAIRANPHVAMMFRNGQKRVFLQFAGRARIAEGAERDQVYDSAPDFERNADPEKKGVGIVIDLDSVEGILGLDAEGARRPVRMTRD